LERVPSLFNVGLSMKGVLVQVNDRSSESTSASSNEGVEQGGLLLQDVDLAFSMVNVSCSNEREVKS